MKILVCKRQRNLWLFFVAVGCCAAAAPLMVHGQSGSLPTVAYADLPDAPIPNNGALSDAQAATQQEQKDKKGQDEKDKQSPQQPAGEPSLGDLGFTPQQTQGSAQLQALLDKRTHMLKLHQRLGLITAIPMVATVITGPMVKAKGRNGQTITEPSQANLDFHAALGGATTGLYFWSAYYAMFAPSIPGTQRRGAIRFHRALEFVHGPGMIATPILGAMAFKQEQAGEKVHGIASAHGAVAWVTVAAYGAAIISVSWPIKIHF